MQLHSTAYATSNPDVTEATSNPVLRARVLTAIRKAGRPLTRGELRMHLRGPVPPATVLQAALDALLIQGQLAQGAEPNRWRGMVITYRAVAVDEPPPIVADDGMFLTSLRTIARKLGPIDRAFVEAAANDLERLYAAGVAP